MKDAVRILESASKSLEVEIRMWTEQNQPELVEKCKKELEDVKTAIKFLYTETERFNETETCNCQEPRQVAAFHGKFICCNCNKPIAN